MPRFITVGIVILHLLALFSPCSAMEAVSGRQAAPKGKSANERSNFLSHSAERKVVNIVVDRIKGGVIYSKDWQTFRVPGSAKIIDNSHSATKMRTAELFFENGRLETVILK